MKLRDEVINAVNQIIKLNGENKFTPAEVVNYMIDSGTIYKATAIKSQVCSVSCGNSVKNHTNQYNDFERIGRGLYRLVDEK